MAESDKTGFRRQPEQERGQNTVKAIMRAAADLIGRKGTDALSMTELAKNAGMSKPALYRYFPNKQAIYREMAREMFEENHALVMVSLPDLGEGEEMSLRSSVEKYCDIQHSRPYRIHLRSAIGADPELANMDLNDSRANAEEVTRALSDKFPNLDRAALNTRLFLMMSFMDTLAHVTSHVDEKEAQVLITEFTRLFIKGLGIESESGSMAHSIPFGMNLKKETLMSGKTIEFFWDAASPYTYMASTQIEDLAARCGATVQWRPFLIGAAFKATGNAPPAIAVPTKGKYMMQDLRNCAAYLGIPITMPAAFPINSLLPMRAALAAEQQGKGAEFARAVMHAHWGEGKDVSQPEVLGEVAAALGLDGEALLAATQEQSLKDALKANCDDAIARGAFGAPTFFVGDAMFWGHDRLPILEAYLQGKLAA